ncbi:MAG: glycosyltransferase family 39 protein, partial [Chloroflexi bacterium]|nr:glycosyltransferase family 39 protein [Chloroflexota bacterium]
RILFLSGGRANFKMQISKYLIAGSFEVEGKSFRALLGAHYPIIGVLLGALLVAASTGTYTNWDSQLEYQAASNVVAHGFPYVTTGLMINQPPLGFYMDAPIFHALGLSYANGVGVVAAFGLGCVALIYALGALLYGKQTGLVAAALFGIIPWHVYISKIFLIDNQSLFFSLLFLIVGVLAVRRNSQKLLLAAGVFFAVALMTKLFAVFMLVPMLLMIFLQRKEAGFKLTLRKVLIFLLPTVVLQAVWFGGLANQNFFGVYFSSDITHPVLVADPSPLFLPIILVKSAGWFLFAAGLFSLALSIAYRKIFAKMLWLDAVCVGTIAAVAGLDLFLVFGFHLTVPYVSACKYNYFALPFYCLLAAALATKGSLLVASVDWKKKADLVKPILVGFGVVLLFASLLESMMFLVKWVGFASFGVNSVTYYPFDVFSGPMGGYVQGFHDAAFVLVVLSLVFPFMVRGIRMALRYFS